jgi:uncharacterized protein YaiE (UPF0345 family)
VYKKQQSKWEPTRINEASRLNWSISGSAEITLEPGAEARLNVCHSQSNSDQLIHDSDWKVIDAIDDLKVPGKYSFDVKVTGKDCAPAYVSVEVGFASTQWDGIECRLHPYLTKDRSDFG